MRPIFVVRDSYENQCIYLYFSLVISKNMERRSSRLAKLILEEFYTAPCVGGSDSSSSKEIDSYHLNNDDVIKKIKPNNLNDDSSDSTNDLSATCRESYFLMSGSNEVNLMGWNFKINLFSEGSNMLANQ
ncbi:hypothetical protein VNO77_01922 [Canavalia gladiata]|uniref:Uncharacterized protein n=1 Tax=Canavalia gladiata TaxID=3824 RepID=A0AAN9MWX1_CANGL